MEINRYLDFRHRHQLVIDLIIWLFWSWALLFIGNLISARFSSILPYLIYSPEPIRVAVFFLFLIVLVILTKDFFQFILVNFKKNKIYIFSKNDWPNKWIFNGKTDLSDTSYLYVKSSRAGCLLKDNYWKNFRMSFEMRFLNEKEVGNDNDYQKRVGLIFRAEDLDNYFMLEIGKAVEDRIDSSIKPHVRFRGGWDIASPEESPEVFNFSLFEEVVLEVINDSATLFYKHTPVFSWVLPTHVDVNHIESGVRDENNGTDNQNITVKAFAGHVQDISFRMSYGLVGFRAYMKHGAKIRNLRIDPL